MASHSNTNFMDRGKPQRKIKPDLIWFYFEESVLRSFTQSRASAKLFSMYYVYIIQSQKDKSYYVGMTKDLKIRLQEHNRGDVKFTLSKIPYELVWYCAFLSKKKALDFEKYLKQGSGFALAKKRLI